MTTNHRYTIKVDPEVDALLAEVAARRGLTVEQVIALAIRGEIAVRVRETTKDE